MQQMNNEMIVSYLTLRKTIGYVAVGMPVFLVVGSVLVGDCSEIQSSISDYYHTQMRDGLVGTICAIAFFLFAYKGYDVRDFRATRLAGVSALLVAFFPTIFTGEAVAPCNDVRPIENGLVNNIHFISALVFFLTLSYISLFLFTQSNRSPSHWARPKKNRNRIYRICGMVMLGCIGLLALYFFWLEEHYPELGAYDPVFWLESLALWAFGLSWLTKGRLFFRESTKEISG
ncbi:DUF998 domain-containing protein [Robiginitalea sp. SC105]|uniref:DUF998 domain-containing protein n=1 Tax=Robiginitalea sp. SC105 TaxID=2762332 RepID=UPI00163B43A4|nr:DUF998 domain-containing protein [Robiginitalea sp. SC105]MBC2839707.1 DUF998 domain-containing protein [Robiginitalea sp. SC105]